MHREGPGDPHDFAGAAELASVLDAVPQHRGNAAGAIAERQLQKVAAVATPPDLNVSHEQGLCDLRTICKLPHQHGRTKIEWPADGRFMDRTAIVTGGTGGLGAAVVARLLDDGWRLVVPWIVERELERVQRRDGLELVQADLFDQRAVEAVVAAACDDGEAPLRGVVNLVGGFAAGGRVHETPIEEFEQQFRLNLRPTYLVIQAALPHLLATGGGSIVCVGTRAALQPFSGAAGYIASKAAVIAFAQAIAAEYRNDAVRCNAILPSVIDTPANRASMPNADHDRWVKPIEIAGVIAHLLSDDSSPTSGAAVPVYGRA
jgi:NAD(P)-dependent dehydrogenase (short-subunit alcohol dehydrogenase family)